MSNGVLGFLQNDEANDKLFQELFASRLKDISRDYEALSSKDPNTAKVYKDTMIRLVGSEDGFVWDPSDLHKLIRPLFETAGLTYGESAKAAVDAFIEALERNGE